MFNVIDGFLVHFVRYFINLMNHSPLKIIRECSFSKKRINFLFRKSTMRFWNFFIIFTVFLLNCLIWYVYHSLCFCFFFFYIRSLINCKDICEIEGSFHVENWYKSEILIWNRNIRGTAEIHICELTRILDNIPAVKMLVDLTSIRSKSGTLKLETTVSIKVYFLSKPTGTLLTFENNLAINVRYKK